MSESYYNLAQICRNGHVITSIVRDYPNRNQDHCDRCGAPTITSCPSCNADIRGYYHAPDALNFRPYTAPAFCHKCGKPFPWTAAGLSAAEELADELEGLTEQERESLKKSLNDLIRETPNTRVAETRFKRLMKKVGKDGYESMRSILTDMVSETVRKTVFGS